jgi:UDP-glucuronate 4-epimerase
MSAMAVMITGGTGFVGLNLAGALLARGEHVVIAALDDVPGEALADFVRLPGRLTAARCDARDEAGIADLMRAHAVDRLFPFAAITSGARRETEAPEAVIEVNLLGFIAQLRAARAAGVRRVVAPASGAVYGESFYQRALLDETTTPCVPLGIYGVTKYAVDRSALRLAALWDMDIVVARIGSVFGPWERDTGLRDLLTPHWALARAAQRREHAVLPATIPDYAWIYARDVGAGLLHLLDLEAPVDHVFNLCSGQNWGSVITLWADLLAQRHPGFTWSQATQPAHVTIPFSEILPRGRMDIARLQATGWSPRFPPEAAYSDYAEWVQNHTIA